MKPKLGSIASRTKGKPLSALAVTQYALEEATKRIAALEKQCDGLARLNKRHEFRLNHFALVAKRLEQRVYSGDSE